MAEPLKNQFGVDIPVKIGGMILAHYPQFDHAAFVRDCVDGYADLELMPRARKIARTLHVYLPDDYPAAIEILLVSLGSPLDRTEQNGMAPFFYLPHVFYVAEYGLEHFEESMRAQYELTQRFTAEFSIRPFLARYPAKTLARLGQWASDPSAHVRRLVSEGTRPRLPWAPRLPAFQKDPRPVLALLELLKDDPELYVRRSVANNLNDIGKDHPQMLVETAARWMKNASEERLWLVRHALRSALKRADTGALGVLGFGSEAGVSIGKVRITPIHAHSSRSAITATIGGAIEIAFEVSSTVGRHQRILVDFRIHFVKANGRTSPKVFKLKTIDLAPDESVSLSKKVSLAEMTTRKHFAGSHQVDVVLNGIATHVGSFELAQD